MKKTVKNLITWSPSHLITSQKSAFTLAEVLITLAIIGVVAAMTIPTLMTSYKEKTTVSHLNKLYATLANALQLSIAEYGPVSTWGLNSTNANVDEDGNILLDYTGARLIANRLMKHMRVLKVCEVGEICKNVKECFLDNTCSEVKPLAAEYEGTIFILQDGTLVSMGWTQTNGQFDIRFTLPTNGTAYHGKSIFYFHYENDRLYPDGWKGAPGNNTFENRCNVGTNQNGRGCTAWVIQNKNMDYLHCRDKLSWTGARSCKEAD